MSIHTDKAFHAASERGAWAGSDYHRWNKLVSMSKRELIEIALHLASRNLSANDDSDVPLLAFVEVITERDTLRLNGHI